ncbi:unnamed protein product [Pedinophyceae sp. YPF-701]|nr:unnamed protein product [Pedinophyceae sp. YPF-701]
MDFLKGACSAAQCGDVEKLRRLIERDPAVATGAGDGSGGSGYTPLHYAARGGHDACVQVLLSAGADVNARTGAGQATPLHRAAYMGHAGTLDILLAAGADPAAQDADGATPGHKAAAQGHSAVAVRLLEHGRSVRSLRDKHGKTVDDVLRDTRA